MTKYIQFRTEAGSVVTASIDELTLYRPSLHQFACKISVADGTTYDVSKDEIDRILAVLEANDIKIYRTAELKKENARLRSCNAFEMREALKAVVEKLLDCAPTAEQEWPELVQQARAALAAPARNCDRFANADEARDAWDEISLREDTDVFGWLFSTVKGI